MENNEHITFGQYYWKNSWGLLLFVVVTSAVTLAVGIWEWSIIVITIKIMATIMDKIAYNKVYGKKKV